jgi:hypothetical protein
LRPDEEYKKYKAGQDAPHSGKVLIVLYPKYQEPSRREGSFF